MNCDNGNCLQQSLSARLLQLSANFLHKAWSEIVAVADRRQRLIELRTQAINFALAQRVCCRPLLGRDERGQSREDAGHA